MRVFQRTFALLLLQILSAKALDRKNKLHQHELNEFDERVDKSFTIYDNYCLVNAVPFNFVQLSFLQSLFGPDTLGVQFWVQPGRLNYPVIFILPNVNRTMLLKRCHEVYLNITFVLPNLQRAFNKQSPKDYARRKLYTFNWNNYFDGKGIQNWMKDLAAAHEKHIQLTQIGRTYLGNSLEGVSFIAEESNKHIFVEGGLDSREWISPAVVTYMINEFAEARETNNTRLLTLLESYNWHLFPLLNPDGYDYSHTDDRMWSKNRRVVTKSGGVGVNLRNNFDYEFASNGHNYDSSGPYYAGAYPFSENETLAIQTFVKSLAPNLDFYFSIQGFGQAILLPYSDMTHEPAGDYENIFDLAAQAAHRAKKLYDQNYRVGTKYSVLGYTDSGGSADYVKQLSNSTVALTFLLRDLGTYGHALPPKYIEPACEEAMALLTEVVGGYDDDDNATHYGRRSFELTGDANTLAGAAVMLFLNIILV